MDRKAKIKEKMVGMVKLGGDLVSRGLVPCDGVMQWIHTLLSEKTQEVYATGSDSVPGEDALQEKDIEQREVQLEVLCAILASMGSSLSDSNTWSAENRLVIEDVFMQLQQLSMDTANLSLRIRCLIRDILDLRMAHWKEKEGKLKPGMLQPRKKESDDEDGQRDEVSEGKQWLDPQLLSSLQAVNHHLELYDDRDSKFHRLTALIKVYHIMKEQQIVIVANSSNVRQVLELIAESFKDIDCKSLDFSTPEQIRKKYIKSFETGETSVLVMASEVSTRRDFDFGKPSPVMVNFDFPMTLQLYLYRIFKRADSSTHVYTFFSPHFDIRHTVALVAAMEGAKQQIPAPLQKLKDQIRSEGSSRRDAGNRRTPKSSETRSELDDDSAARGDRGERVPPWKEKRGGASQGDGLREDRMQAEHLWGDEGSDGVRGGHKASKSRPSGASWREGRREESKEEPGQGGAAPAPRQADEQSRRREPTRREAVAEPQEAGPEGRDGWQKSRGPNSRRSQAGRSRDGAGDERAANATLQQVEEPGPRTERPPWFDASTADGHSEPRRQILVRGQQSSNEQSASRRPERRTDSGEASNPRAPTSSSVASSSAALSERSTIRQRRHDASFEGGQANTADTRKEHRPRFSALDASGDSGPAVDKERRHTGPDRQRDSAHGSAAPSGSRGGNFDSGTEKQAPQHGHHGHRHRHGVARLGDQHSSRRDHFASPP